MKTTNLTEEERARLSASRITEEEFVEIFRSYLPKFQMNNRFDFTHMVTVLEYLGRTGSTGKCGISAGFSSEALQYTTREIADWNARTMVATLLRHMADRLSEGPLPLTGFYEVSDDS